MKKDVGFINYLKHIRVKIINKSIDIPEIAEPGEIRKYWKPAQEIQEIKMEWKEKVKLHQVEAISEKEVSCLKDESIIYELIERLKR